MKMWKYVVALLVPGVVASASWAQTQNSAQDNAQATAEAAAAQPCDGAVMYALDNWYQVQRCEQSGFLLPDEMTQSSADFWPSTQASRKMCAARAHVRCRR